MCMRIKWWLWLSGMRAPWSRLKRRWARSCRPGRRRGSGCLWIRLGTMRAEKFRGRSGARNLFPGQRDFALQHEATADACGNAGLNEAGHAAGDFGFELECFAGEDCAEDFRGADGGEF